MDNKLMAQIFSDVIAVAQQPLVINGAIYKKHRRQVTIQDVAIDAMLYAMAELHCKAVEFGSYDCYEDTKYGFGVDGCLVGEINGLNHSGIKTIGCCCGHSRQRGYIQVAPKCAPQMIELGYKQLPIDRDGNGKWCFKPKTLLPFC